MTRSWKHLHCHWIEWKFASFCPLTNKECIFKSKEKLNRKEYVMLLKVSCTFILSSCSVLLVQGSIKTIRAVSLSCSPEIKGSPSSLLLSALDSCLLFHLVSFGWQVMLYAFRAAVCMFASTSDKMGRWCWFRDTLLMMMMMVLLYSVSLILYMFCMTTHFASFTPLSKQHYFYNYSFPDFFLFEWHLESLSLKHHK